MFSHHGRAVRATAFRAITEREAHLGKIQKQAEDLAVANEELESTNEELHNIIEEMESANEELTRSQEELMEHERALMASEEKYQRLYNQAIEGMFQMTPGGIFQKANPALAGFLGFPSVAEMIAAAEEDINRIFAHPREANRLRKLVLAFGRIEHAEVEVRTASGGKAWGLVNAIAERNEKGIIASIHGSCIDITRLKLTEWALRESEEKYRILIEEAADPIFSLSPDGRYLFANRAFAEGVGHPIEEVPGRTVYDIFPSDEAESRMELLKQAIQTASEKQTENRVPRQDGDRYYITTFKPIMDGAGRIISVLCSSKNITERRKATMELEKALEEKHILFNELQHRVKNNLSIVISLLSLGMNQISDETSRKIIRDSQSRIRTMAAFYEQLCRSDTPGSVELHRYIRQLAAALVDTLSSGGMKVELETRLAEVSFDTRRSVPLGLIVNELITNSLKHAHPGGRGCRIRIELENSDGVISLTVSDDGRGFPEGFSPDAHMNSMGVNLITALAAQIQAGVKFVNDNGARVTVEFPLQA
jgi:PAS domain S-box-containing protein